MATWITHLRIAELFNQTFPVSDYGIYLIGNIAPDSGKLNDDRLTYSPSSDVSHFQESNANKWHSRDLRFYHKYLTNQKKSSRLKSFLTGYYHHLVVDALWGQFIHYPTKKRYTEEYKDPQFIWEVKKDWYGADFDYLSNFPHWETWKVFTKSFYDIDALDFYPQRNIVDKHLTIKEFYSTDRDFESPGIYLSLNHMNKFVTLASSILIHIEQFFSSCHIPEDGSILEFLEEDHELLSDDQVWIGDIPSAVFADYEQK
jgi:hypothetical protein